MKKYIPLLAIGLLMACSSTTEDTVNVSTTVNNITRGTQDDLVANVGDRVFFDLNSVNLSPKSEETLGLQADWLHKYDGVSVKIEGHADERGTREYNIELGARRALVVKNYLIANGIHDSRISLVSYGKERPVVSEHNEAAWAKNRRSVTIVVN